MSSWKKHVSEHSKTDITKRLNSLPVDIRHRTEDRLHVKFHREKHTYISRLELFFMLIGPGILVMIADNDAGGVITYAQTGSIFGIGFFIPFMILMLPVAYFVQEMTVRLGAVTHRGHAELIWKRYGKFWGSFSLGDLVIANFLTLVTEFIGITVGMSIFGVPRIISAVIFVFMVIVIQLFLRYYTWERISLFIAVFNLVFIPLLFFLPHPSLNHILDSFATWKISGGVSSLFIYVLLANLGTTIAPWMLFFQQSSVVDKGMTKEDIKFGQRDTLIGASVMVVVAIAIIILTGTTVFGSDSKGTLGIGDILRIFAARVGIFPMELFALGLVEAGFIAAIAISASTSWAMSEAFGWKKSINLPAREGVLFYVPSFIALAIAASITLIPNAPLGYLNLTVQVIATIFMPAAMLFLLLLLNDRGIMGNMVNKKWQNAIGFSIIGFLILMNGLYGLSVALPSVFSHLVGLL
ncbi:MAG: divalent metal cation transporter [Candidatus Thermoplasmatota archaeon]|uniref:NRAMP family divalent metal transporter n=1 Tax=Ferroplasma sp. TaxID=2591003 RepID=UPI002639C47C|nr:NRAMP family divalent metal transporter [Ferroplasma sp.]MCL4311500.1 divalent metal cation transporter [Candidatus Thermoplasmatota archaeon]